MNVLALDTSFGACSAAVLAGGVSFARYEEMARGHAEALTPMIAEAMREAGIRFGALDRIAATTGPGSFTGVRIAIAAAQGLAIATGAELWGADSLAVMARRLEIENVFPGSDGPVAIAVDARRGEVYWALFGGEGAGAPSLLLAGDAARLAPEGATIAGSGALAVADAACGKRLRAIAPGLQPHAAALAALAAESPSQAGPLRPLYLRAPDAKPSSAPSLRAP
jgi:tRNA threonylcarbamoyladenosine biosynthesis protein TsaB